MENLILSSFPKEINLTVKDLFEPFHVKVKLPKSFHSLDLLGGDWGPAYRIHLKPTDQIKVSYHAKHQTDEIDVPNEIREIYLNSPMLSQDRDKTPLYFRLHLEHLGIVLHFNMKSDLSICNAYLQKYYDATASLIQVDRLEFIN